MFKLRLLLGQQKYGQAGIPLIRVYYWKHLHTWRFCCKPVYHTHTGISKRVHYNTIMLLLIFAVNLLISLSRINCNTMQNNTCTLQYWNLDLTISPYQWNISRLMDWVKQYMQCESNNNSIIYVNLININIKLNGITSIISSNK